MYAVALGNACLYCWFGNELSEQVRKIMLSNKSRIYLSQYFHQRKNILLRNMKIKKIIPSDT